MCCIMENYAVRNLGQLIVNDEFLNGAADQHIAKRNANFFLGGSEKYSTTCGGTLSRYHYRAHNLDAVATHMWIIKEAAVYSC